MVQGSGPGNKDMPAPTRTKSAAGETQGRECPPFPRAQLQFVLCVSSLFVVRVDLRFAFLPGHAFLRFAFQVVSVSESQMSCVSHASAFRFAFRVSEVLFT